MPRRKFVPEAVFGKWHRSIGTPRNEVDGLPCAGVSLEIIVYTVYYDDNLMTGTRLLQAGKEPHEGSEDEAKVHAG